MNNLIKTLVFRTAVGCGVTVVILTIYDVFLMFLNINEKISYEEDNLDKDFYLMTIIFIISFLFAPLITRFIRLK